MCVPHLILCREAKTSSFWLLTSFNFTCGYSCMLKLFSLLSSLCPTHQQDVLTPIYRFKVGTCLLMTSPCHASYCISWQTLLWEKNGCLIIFLVMTLPYRVQGLPISISSVRDPCHLAFPSVRSLGSSRSIFLPGRWPRQHSRLAPLSERYWIFHSSSCSLVWYTMDSILLFRRSNLLFVLNSN